jgi:hypothetical protein
MNAFIKHKNIYIASGVVILWALLFWRMYYVNKDEGAKTQEYLKSTTEIAKPDILSKVKAESLVKDAIINEAQVLYITVNDDGTNRNGLAEYFCQTYKVNGVKIIKANSSNSPDRDCAYGIIIGESNCKF